LICLCVFFCSEIKPAAVGRPSTLSAGASRSDVVNRGAANQELHEQGYVMLHNNASPRTPPMGSRLALGVRLSFHFIVYLLLSDVISYLLLSDVTFLSRSDVTSSSLLQTRALGLSSVCKQLKFVVHTFCYNVVEAYHYIHY